MKGVTDIFIGILLSAIGIFVMLIVFATVISSQTRGLELVLKEYELSYISHEFYLVNHSITIMSLMNMAEAVFQEGLTGFGHEYWYIGETPPDKFESQFRYKPSKTDLIEKLSKDIKRYLLEEEMAISKYKKDGFIRYPISSFIKLNIVFDNTLKNQKLQINETCIGFTCNKIHQWSPVFVSLKGIDTKIENIVNNSYELKTYIWGMAVIGDQIIEYITKETDSSNINSAFFSIGEKVIDGSVVQTLMDDIEDIIKYPKNKEFIDTIDKSLLGVDSDVVKNLVDINVKLTGPYLYSFWYPDEKTQDGVRIYYEAEYTIKEKNISYPYIVFSYNKNKPTILETSLIQCSKDVNKPEDLPDTMKNTDCFKYFDVFKKYWKENELDKNIPLLLLFSISMQESGCNQEVNEAGIMQVDYCAQINCDAEENIRRATKKLSSDIKTISRWLNERELDMKYLIPLVLFSYNRGIGTTKLAIDYLYDGEDLYDAMKKACFQLHERGLIPCSAPKEVCCDAPGYGARYPERILKLYESYCSSIGGEIEKSSSLMIENLPSTPEDPTKMYYFWIPFQLRFKIKDYPILINCSNKRFDNTLISIYSKDDSACFNGQFWMCGKNIIYNNKKTIHNDDEDIFLGDVISSCEKYKYDHEKDINHFNNNIPIDAKLAKCLGNEGTIYTNIDCKIGPYVCAKDVSTGEQRFCKKGNDYSDDEFCCYALDGFPVRMSMTGVSIGYCRGDGFCSKNSGENSKNSPDCKCTDGETNGCLKCENGMWVRDNSLCTGIQYCDGNVAVIKTGGACTLSDSNICSTNYNIIGKCLYSHETRIDCSPGTCMGGICVV